MSKAPSGDCTCSKSVWLLQELNPLVPTVIVTLCLQENIGTSMKMDMGKHLHATHMGLAL